MKQFTEKSSASAVVTITVISLAGLAVLALGNSQGAFLQKRKLKNKDKIAAIDGQIEAITAENASLKQNMELMSASLDKMIIQNEKLMTSNKNLALALKEEHERVVKLMNIVSEESAEKLVLTQKLEECYNKLKEYAAIKPDAAEIPENTKAKEFIA